MKLNFKKSAMTQF